VQVQREHAQRIASLMLEVGLAEHAAADRNHGIGGEHEGLGVILLGADELPGCFRLGARETAHDVAGHLALGHALVDRGRAERIRGNADLLQQRQTARRGRGQHELRPEARCGAHPRGARGLGRRKPSPLRLRLGLLSLSRIGSPEPQPT